MSAAWIYSLDDIELAKESARQRGIEVGALLGGKGLGLAEMASLGLPVPAGFVATTEACWRFLDTGGEWDPELWREIEDGMARLEKQLSLRLGDPDAPLLVSCRSGARASMPGMMDTVLNLGMNREVAEALAKRGEGRFAYDCYRRLIHMFGTVVEGLDDEVFEEILADRRRLAGVASDAALSESDWREVCEAYERSFERGAGHAFPGDPKEQIKRAIGAVFKSWNGKRAVDYRNASGIPHDWGTAANIVAMVFGNRGPRSATGVVFTRDPGDGGKRLYGDFLVDAQGEDVVAGIRNTRPIAELRDEFPDVYPEFESACGKLESNYRDMQDIEFTIEDGTLWLLQTRSGKRTPQAAVAIAVDLVKEGLIERQDALRRVSTDQVNGLLHPSFDAEAKSEAKAEGRLLATGVNASPGAACGKLALDADTAEAWGKAGEAVIMVRPFTKPDDVHGMLASKGILTAEGGATSHAAVVARQFGLPCVVGASSLHVDFNARRLVCDERVVKEGELISLDGIAGESYVGEIAMAPASIGVDSALQELLGWADQASRLGVRANADYPEDALRAISFGADGIGLCRTEHMFFQPERLPVVQEMILARDDATEDACLARLLEVQRSDFLGLFEALSGKPIVIRLIDPPLHEFLPDKEKLLIEVHDLRRLGTSELLREKEELLEAIGSFHESNPMLGLRGVRLSIELDKIVSMQTRAIFEAACDAQSSGIPVSLGVMIPLVCHVNELRHIQPKLDKIARGVMAERNQLIEYEFGTMIELPRACVTAGEIAAVTTFFSFGTNDLTQTTLGLSRDDAEAGFLRDYLKLGILLKNPFQTVDRDGVGVLMRQAIELGRAANPRLRLGVCGEHGGDAESIGFFHDIGLDYVSCSPYRVPGARLAAAQAALRSAEHATGKEKNG